MSIPDTPLRARFTLVRHLSRMVLALLAIGASAEAQQRPLAPPDTHHVSVTVSGGVSLGSYQAGATWAFIFALRQQEKLRKWKETSIPGSLDTNAVYVLDVLTGASAGNINAVLAAHDYCAYTVYTKPSTSLMWKSWINIGWQELMPPGANPDTAIFNRRQFDTLWAKDIRPALDSVRDARPKCDLLLGITATKITPEKIRIANGLDAPAQRFAAIFRMVTTDSGVYAFAEPTKDHVDDDFITDAILLHPRTDDGVPRQVSGVKDAVEIADNTVKSLVKASSSFPLAFAPTFVSYRRLDELKQQWGDSLPPCMPLRRSQLKCEAPEHNRFVDGGYFDNRPLGLALALGDARDNRQRTEKANVDRIAAALEAGECRNSDKAKRLRAMLTPDTAQSHTATHAEGYLGGFRSVAAAVLDSSSLEPACLPQVRSSVRAALSAEQRLKPRVLYYIDDDTRRGIPPEAHIAPSEARGGLGAVFQLVGNGMNTGQNSEMRAFATRLDIERRHASGRTLALNSRYAWLMGEQMDHFGGFLARAFREHDFYVGVYDGLRSAFREMYCKPNADTTCEVEWLRVTLDSDAITLDTEGRAMIERLLELEETPERRSVQIVDTNPRAYMLVKLLEANHSVHTRPPTPCSTHSVREGPLCDERMLNIVRAWKDSLRSGRSDWVKVLCKTPQSYDETNCLFARDPRAQYNRILLDALERFYVVEDRLANARGTPGYPEVPSFLLYFQRAYTEQFRSCRYGGRRGCFDPNPSTMDVEGARGWDFASRFLPQSFSVMRDGNGGWFTWRPTLFLWHWPHEATLALTVPLEAARVNSADGWVRTGNVGYGIQVLRSGILPLLTSVSASRIYSFKSADAQLPASTDITSTWVGGLVRIGERSQKFGPTSTKWNMTIGVGDVNGLSMRLVRLGANAVRYRVRPK